MEDYLLEKCPRISKNKLKVEDYPKNCIKMSYSGRMGKNISKEFLLRIN